MQQGVFNIAPAGLFDVLPVMMHIQMRQYLWPPHQHLEHRQTRIIDKMIFLICVCVANFNQVFLFLVDAITN